MDTKEFLQGKRWWGEPIHPALVHLPVGLWVGALVFDIISICGPANNAMAQTAFWCIVGGLVSAILAIPFGLADWWGIKKEKPAYKLGLIHAGLNTVVFLIFLANFFLRLPHLTTIAHITIPQLILTIVGDAILLVSGYIGGRMVYEHGISVARLSKDKWRELALVSGANVPDKA